MNKEEVEKESRGATAAPSEALAAPDPGAALRNAVGLWAEQNTRPETLARADKLRDKVSAITSSLTSRGSTWATSPQTMSRAVGRGWSGGG